MRIRKVSAAKWSALVRLIVIAAAIVTAMPAHAQEASLTGTITDYDGRRAARRDGHRSAHRHRQHLRRCDRRGRRVPPARAGRRLPRVRRALRLCHGRPHDLAARRADGGRESADVDGGVAGIGHRQRTGAAGRRHHILGGQGDRFAAGQRPSRERPQLGRPRHAGARQPSERLDRRAGDAGGNGRRGDLSAQRRRPARDAEPDRAASASRSTARTRSPSSSSSRTASMRRRAARWACR